MDFMGFKKKFFRYLLNHYLGQFLQEKFSLEQLTVDLYNGKGNVKNVALDCQALNQLAEEQNIPVEFIEVTFGSITVTVPWTKLMVESCRIEVSGLYVVIQPKNRIDNGNSMLNSMFSSMASSMHIAEDFIRTCETEEDQGSSTQSMRGVEAIAQTINAVLTRVKVDFHDSVIRVERAQRPGSNIGIALELRIKSWNYSDESSANLTDDQRVYDTAFQLKKLSLQGIKIYSDIYKQFSHFDAPQQSSNDDEEVDNLILMANFTGMCDIGLKIKTDESMGGPQISLDCSFGSMIALLTPVQAHIFYLILEDFLEPPSSPYQESFRQHLKEKPMDSFDFMRIKEELEETNRKDTIGLPGMQHPGWSSSPLDDDSDDRFLPFKARPSIYSSVHSNLMETSMTSEAGSMNRSMMESTMSIGGRSGVSSLTMTSPYKSPTGQSHLGMNMIASHADKTKFAISIASAAVILLHDDILTLSSAMAVARSTVREMQTFASDFFKQFGIVSASGGKRQVEELKASLEKACPKSCLRLIAAPVKLEGTISLEDSVPTTSGHVSFAFFQLMESLKENYLPGSGQPTSIVTEVLNFSQNHQFSGKESLKIEFKHKTFRSRTSVTKTDIRVHLQECESEFDMSILDRLNSLLQPKLPFILDGHKQDTFAGLNNKAHNVMHLKVTSPKCSVDFRFPIPDMRKSDDQNKIPYWTRNVRSDSIIFKLKELSFNTCINSQSDVLEFDTQCQECKLYYKAKPTDLPLHFATASANDIINSDSDFEAPSLRGFDRPRVVVSIFPERKAEIVSENTASKAEEDDSLAHFMSMSNFKSAPSPFSSRRVVHECLSSNPEDKANGSFGESVIPGDPAEMKRFIDDTIQNVMYKVDCNLRSVQVNMPSKEFFEEIYNRLSMDLLLWEPLAPKQSSEEQSGGGGGGDKFFRASSGPQQFSMCKSGLRLECDSGSDDDEDGTFYSSSNKFGGRRKNKKAQSEKNKRVLPQGQSEVTINLVISHGVCAFFTPFEDTLGNIVPELKGQVTLEIEKGNLFIVSGYKGSRNAGYLCLHSHRATFFHSELVKSNDLIPRTELKRTIYPSDEGVLTTRTSSDTSSYGNENQDMLSVAIKIDKDELKNIKNFKVAVGIKGGTIDYRMSLPNRNWFTQIVDFFDVTDISVEGYTPSAVITELHVHLWNCAASYAPLQLPLRSILTVENLSISVNIAAQTNMKVIRFIAEDAALFITNKKESSDLRHDYVCVMDMDLFELLLRICVNRNNDPAVSGVPQFDLKASNNVLHVRTCSDSIKVLLELITHLANNGDLPEKDILSELDELGIGGGATNPVPANSESMAAGFFDAEDFSGAPSLPTPAARERKYSQSQTIYSNQNPNQTQNQTQADHLHTMVAEAMQENLHSNLSQENSSLKKVGSGRSSKSRSASGASINSAGGGGNFGSGFGTGFGTSYGKPQSIEIHFEPGQKMYGAEDSRDYDEEEEEEFNEDKDVEGSNVSTPAPPLFHRDDPIMESCDGLPVTIQMSDEDEEEFCILENDPGVGILPRNGEPEVRMLTNKPIEVIENHFSVPVGKVDILLAPKHYPKPVTRFTVQEMSLVWHLYGGEDFGSGGNFRSSQRTVFGGSSETLSHEFKRGDSYDRSDQAEVDLAIDALNPGAFFSKTNAFENPWEGSSSPKSQRRHSVGYSTTWRAQGGKGRNHDKLVELQLSKIKFQHEVYPQNTEQASRQVLVINSVEILDKLKSSLYNKMLYLYTSPTLPKQSYANMVVIKAAHIRPDPQLNIEECCLKVSLLPIRLNIDQETILFLVQFFTELVASKDDEDDSISSSSARPPSHTPSCESLPVMMVNTKEGGSEDPLLKEKELQSQFQPSTSLEDESVVSNLISLADDPLPTQIPPHQSQSAAQDDNVSVCSKDPSVDSLRPSAPIYFREVIFSPEVPMRIDYTGRNMYDMTNGPIPGILMGFGQLDGAEIRLIRLTNNRGILGVGKLLGFFGTEWVADIRTNQIPSVLGGVDILIPMHSFVQLFQGVKNLFYLPVEQYQKDGRLAKGLQRGVNSFSTSAAMAVLKLTNRMVQAFQGAAEFTYDMVSPGPSVQQQRRHSSTKKKRYSQPSDVREGVTNAYNVVREGLGDTAHSIARVVAKENEQKGVSGAVGGVLRQIPPAFIVRPIILVAEATSNVLEGLKSQLEPETKKEAAEKWKDS